MEKLPKKLMQQSPTRVSIKSLARRISQRFDRHIQEYRLKPDKNGIVFFSLPIKTMQNMSCNKVRDKYFRSKMIDYDYMYSINGPTVQIRKKLK